VPRRKLALRIRSKFLTGTRSISTHMAPPQQQPPAGAFGSLDCDSAGDHDQPSSFGSRPQPSVRKRSTFAAPAYNVAPASRTTAECVARLRQSSPNESGPPEVSCPHGNSNESQEVHPGEFNSDSRTFSTSWQLDSFDGGATEDTGDVERPHIDTRCASSGFSRRDPGGYRACTPASAVPDKGVRY
jgi:hypothetical protein